jgi:hypothetical protein
MTSSVSERAGWRLVLKREPREPVESVTLNPVGIPALSRPVKLKVVALAFSTAAWALAIAAGEITGVADASRAGDAASTTPVASLDEIVS